MKSATSVVVRACGFAAVGLLVTAAQVLAQDKGSTQTIPTLGGVGIAALAGALSIGGAWLLRQRDKDK